MRNSTHRLISIHQIAWVLAATLALASAVIAQSGNRNPTPTAPGSPRPGNEQRPPSIRERQFRMLEIEREAAQPDSPRDQKIALAQISEDYRELQVINNKMLSVTIPAAAPDYLRVAQTLAEIRKRATRLKENLGFPEVDAKGAAKEKYKPAQDIAGLKVNLLALDDTIMRFVNSSVFRTPSVVDVKEATKAREDVEFIIAVSQLIGKDAEQLKKSSAKN